MSGQQAYPWPAPGAPVSARPSTPTQGRKPPQTGDSEPRASSGDSPVSPNNGSPMSPTISSTDPLGRGPVATRPRRAAAPTSTSDALGTEPATPEAEEPLRYTAPPACGDEEPAAAEGSLNIARAPEEAHSTSVAPGYAHTGRQVRTGSATGEAPHSGEALGGARRELPAGRMFRFCSGHLAALCAVVWTSGMCGGTWMQMHREVMALRQELQAALEALRSRDARFTVERRNLHDTSSIDPMPLNTMVLKQGLGGSLAETMQAVADVHLPRIIEAEAKRRSGGRYKDMVNPLGDGLRIIVAQEAALEEIRQFLRAEVARLSLMISGVEQKVEALGKEPVVAAASCGERALPIGNDNVVVGDRTNAADVTGKGMVVAPVDTAETRRMDSARAEAQTGSLAEHIVAQDR